MEDLQANRRSAIQKELLLSRFSMNPPATVAVDLANFERPSWILLDFTAYVNNRRNNTTATCKFRGGKELQVTFFPAHPPRVSYFCVYCPDFKPCHYAKEPKIIATEANFVLLRIVIGGIGELWSRGGHQYFIYKAGGHNQEASLEQLPHPSPYWFLDQQVGLLGNDTGGYTVAALLDDSLVLHDLDALPEGQYRVCVLNSKDKVWAIKIVSLPQNQQPGFYHETSKVITIGGGCGTMAFVDLWCGILEYDVLEGTPLLRYTKLPETINAPFTAGRAHIVNPLDTRDIAFVNGRIKYVEMAMDFNVSTGYGDWTAATWSIPAITSQDGWRSDGQIEVAKICYGENLFHCAELPKMLKCGEGKYLPLKNLRGGQPTLSLHDDDIVYFMTKLNLMGKKACVVAVNMRQGTVQEVASFGAQRTSGLNFTYTQSRISNYLNITPVKSLSED